ncbi:hypothetical protein HAX54_016356, partial [Datura stramonium]|nr:hypothetical protein [Datura stramonium]
DPLWRSGSRYSGSDGSSLVRYGDTPTVSTVSLQRKFYYCSGPPKLVAPQIQSTFITSLHNTSSIHSLALLE